MLHCLAAPPIQAATSAAGCHHTAKDGWGGPCQACPPVSAAAAAPFRGHSTGTNTADPDTYRQQCKRDYSTWDLQAGRHCSQYRPLSPIWHYGHTAGA